MPVVQQMGRYHLLRLVSKDSKDEFYLAEDQLCVYPLVVNHLLGGRKPADCVGGMMREIRKDAKIEGQKHEAKKRIVNACFTAHLIIQFPPRSKMIYTLERI